MLSSEEYKMQRDVCTTQQLKGLMASKEFQEHMHQKRSRANKCSHLRFTVAIISAFLFGLLAVYAVQSPTTQLASRTGDQLMSNNQSAAVESTPISIYQEKMDELLIKDLEGSRWYDQHKIIELREQVKVLENQKSQMLAENEAKLVCEVQPSCNRNFSVDLQALDSSHILTKPRLVHETKELEWRFIPKSIKGVSSQIFRFRSECWKIICLSSLASLIFSLSLARMFEKQLLSETGSKSQGKVLSRPESSAEDQEELQKAGELEKRKGFLQSYHKQLRALQEKTSEQEIIFSKQMETKEEVISFQIKKLEQSKIHSETLNVKVAQLQQDLIRETENGEKSLREAGKLSETRLLALQTQKQKLKACKSQVSLLKLEKGRLFDKRIEAEKRLSETSYRCLSLRDENESLKTLLATSEQNQKELSNESEHQSRELKSLRHQLIIWQEHSDETSKILTSMREELISCKRGAAQKDSALSHAVSDIAQKDEEGRRRENLAKRRIKLLTGKYEGKRKKVRELIDRNAFLESQIQNLEKQEEEFGYQIQSMETEIKFWKSDGKGLGASSTKNDTFSERPVNKRDMAESDSSKEVKQSPPEASEKETQAMGICPINQPLSKNLDSGHTAVDLHVEKINDESTKTSSKASSNIQADVSQFPQCSTARNKKPSLGEIVIEGDIPRESNLIMESREASETMDKLILGFKGLHLRGDISQSAREDSKNLACKKAALARSRTRKSSKRDEPIVASGHLKEVVDGKERAKSVNISLPVPKLLSRDGKMKHLSKAQTKLSLGEQSKEVPDTLNKKSRTGVLQEGVQISNANTPGLPEAIKNQQVGIITDLQGKSTGIEIDTKKEDNTDKLRISQGNHRGGSDDQIRTLFPEKQELGSRKKPGFKFAPLIRPKTTVKERTKGTLASGPLSVNLSTKSDSLQGGQIEQTRATGGDSHTPAISPPQEAFKIRQPRKIVKINRRISKASATTEISEVKNKVDDTIPQAYEASEDEAATTQDLKMLASTRSLDDLHPLTVGPILDPFQHDDSEDFASYLESALADTTPLETNESIFTLSLNDPSF